MAPRNQKNTNIKFPRGHNQSSGKDRINFKVKHTNASSSRAPFPHDNPNDRFEKRRKLPKAHSLKLAQIEYYKVRQKKMEDKEAANRKREEMKNALEKYKQKKKDKTRKLMAKTSKGQPIMKNRIEMLLEKIQSSIVR